MTYRDLVHAMQTGVAVKMEQDGSECSPKHLRVGVNSALCDSAALARLLIEKGVITADEYQKAITDEMAREVARYEQWLSERGVTIHLR